MRRVLLLTFQYWHAWLCEYHLWAFKRHARFVPIDYAQRAWGARPSSG